jgi:hypothetical protein
MFHNDSVAVDRVTRRWLAVPLLALTCLGFAAAAARADNAALKHALKPYEQRLTADIGYLASFKAPSKKGAASALQKLSKIGTQLADATHVAKTHQASSPSGRTGRQLVLSALNDASAATADAKASATAAHAGKSSTVKQDARQARKKINEAIPLFESGGKKLNLF